MKAEKTLASTADTAPDIAVGVKDGFVVIQVKGLGKWSMTKTQARAFGAAVQKAGL